MMQGKEISRRKKILRYQRNLYSAFIISIMIPILLITAVFFGYYNYDTMKRERQDMQNVLDSVARNIETRFSELVNIGNTYYSEKTVFQEVEALNNPKLYQYYDEIERSRMEREYCERMTKLIHMSIQPVKSVVFFPADESGKYGYYLGKDRSVLTKMVYLTYHEEEWYKEAVAVPEKPIFYGPHIPAYIRNKAYGEVYSCVMAIRNMDTGKVIGVVKIDASAEQIQQEIELESGNRDSGFVLKKGEKIFFKSDSLSDTDLKNIKGYQELSIELKDTGVKLSYYYSKNEFYKNCFLFGVLMILLIAVSIGISFVIYWKKGNRTVEDIRRITEAVKGIEQGNLKQKIEVSSQNELKEIAKIINKMMENLEQYIAQEYLLVIQNQKAEYMALQAQINPHFLYNTLNGFVALNRMGEKKILEKSIIRLSHLFRYTCKESEITDVKAEINFLKEYLELEKLKYEERLEYTVWLEPECEEKQIPKLLLQPIVENSIIHGMEDLEEPLHIEILAVCREIKGIGRVMLLCVRDNGCGYDMREVAESRNSIGMDNTKARTMLFCKEAIYQSISARGKGTKTMFVFPYEE